jgi:hypothetical protein
MVMPDPSCLPNRHWPRRDFPEHADERAAHQHFIGMMENPLWDKYQS